MSGAQRRRVSRLWIFAGCSAAIVCTACLFLWPNYRKARLLQNIEQVHGLSAGYGGMAPDWLRPALEWLGEPRASRIEELFFDDLHTVNLNTASRSAQPALYARILKELQRAQRLQVLDLRHSGITDEEFLPLGRLQELRQLNLGENRLTAKGIETLALLGQLRNLDLSDSELDDAAILPLSRLKNLETLDLSGTQVTDEAVATLQAMKSLRHLDLTRTSVSEAACRRLVDAVPGLDISDD